MAERLKFDKNTPDAVQVVLRYYLNTDQRIRVFYGDPKTGEDWGEEYDISGCVRQTEGGYPMLVYYRNRSWGGIALMTDCIVRITVDKHDVYRHPKYKCKVKVDGRIVYLNGKVWGVADSHDKALKLAKFVSGESNSKA